jgi:hypothetical protein
MKAIAGISAKHMALLDQYRMALSLWSETRALYVPEAMEIVQATKHLEDLEHELVLCDMPAFAPKDSPASDNPIELLPPSV